MAAARLPPQGPNMDVFEAFFKRADLDQDGRISGSEAVAFFQGSNLPKHVLAQIWTHANQSQTSYLGRPEFFNALRLITVAQSGRELTPDIVKAALGPAAAKIPAPQINFVSAPSMQMNSMATSSTQPNAMLSPSSQMGVTGPTAFQNLGVRGQQAFPSMGMNQQFFSTPNNHLMGPPQGTTSAPSLRMHGVGQAPSAGGIMASPRFLGSNTPNLSTDWLGSTSRVGTVPTSQPPSGGVAPVNQDESGLAQLGMAPGAMPSTQMPALSSSVKAKPAETILPSSLAASVDSKALVPTGNGFSPNTAFGEDIFSASPQAKLEARSSTSSSNTISSSQNLSKPGQPDTLHLSPSGNQSSIKQNQLDTVQGTLALATSNVSVAPVTPASNDSQVPWPKITQSAIHKYSKVFVEVDKDRDGKITGEEARTLFLSWRLPREVLKQVWDLSDQDNDSMLSLREFCTALYLMERYREGRPLPTVLPNSVRFDQILLLATGQPSSAPGGYAWHQNPGLPHQGVPGPRPVMPSSVMKPPRTPLPSLPEERVQPQKQKARVPIVEKHLVNQLSEEEQKAINSKFEEAIIVDKKVQELEKEIFESKEKTEFYRTKMQELVLYKSRCDNRLNEVTERVSADKHEVEALAKKYEDKYKQVGDVASKLTLDEATFRDIQERKLELYNAIVKMEQGGTADGALQDRVDKIQSDLEDLVKTLNERCKQYGLRAKPTSLVELPFGWQPGIQEGAADWDEAWDKFNDEGFAIIKELTIEVENIVAKPKPPPVQSDKTSAGEVSTGPLATNLQKEAETGKHEVLIVSTSSIDENKLEAEAVADDEAEKPSAMDHAAEDESAYAHNEDGLASSLHVKSTFESSSLEFPSKQLGFHDLSPHAKDSQSDHGGAESTVSGGDKYLDESSWGTKFDNDDTDSIWGPSSINTKEVDNDRGQHDSFFGPGYLSLNPVRTGSPSAESVYGAEKKGPFFDSVPSTPQYNSSFSPRFNDGPEDHAFDRFSRFDSFNMNDGGLFPSQDSFSRFDSMRSTADAPSYSRFDSMRSTEDVPFGSISRFDSFRSTADPPPPGSLQRFDSVHSTADYGGGFPSFDDADPFGSTGTFKSSETPKHGSNLFGSTGPFKSSETSRHSSDLFSSTGPFGSSETPRHSSDLFSSTGPFKSSETPRGSSDHWSAF